MKLGLRNVTVGHQRILISLAQESSSVKAAALIPQALTALPSS